MREILVVCGWVGLLLLAGCVAPASKMAGKDDGTSEDNNDSRQYWSEGYGVKALTLQSRSAAMKLRRSLIQGKIVETKCFSVPVGVGNETICQQERNAAMATLLAASDELCQEHLKTIYGNDAYYNVLTGSVATFFSGAAAIAGSGSAKSALAAISTFAGAERSLLNETVYKNLLVTATSKKIRETRDAKAAALLPGSLKKPIDDYPMVLAVRDVVDYHYSCSFMLGLEKALEEGTQSGVEGRKARLELEKRRLELDIDNRTAALKASGRGADVATDKGISGEKDRIAAIETQLLALVNVQSPGTGSGATDKSGDNGSPKADPASLSKAYYSLVAALESSSGDLAAKIAAAKAPAPAAGAQSLNDMLKATLTTKMQQVTAALATQTCAANLDKLSKNIAETQGKVASTSGDEKTKQSDALTALQVQAGRFAVRLNAFEALYTSTLAAQGATLDAAKSVLDAALKGQIDGAINAVVVPTGLCAV